MVMNFGFWICDFGLKSKSRRRDDHVHERRELQHQRREDDPLMALRGGPLRVRRRRFSLGFS
jgi:hypothetical protein